MRTYNNTIDSLTPAHAWKKTLECKARRASQGARGKRWYYRALALNLARRIDDALYLGEYGALESDLVAMSGTVEIQPA